MIRLLINWLLSAAAIFLISLFLTGFVVDNFLTALIVAVALGIVNVLIKPIIMILTMPINIITLGLFTIVINAFLLWLVSLVVAGFKIENFLVAIFAVLLLWLINSVVQLLGLKG